MKKTKKLLALLLSVLMCVSLMAYVFAADDAEADVPLKDDPINVDKTDCTLTVTVTMYENGKTGADVEPAPKAPVDLYRVADVSGRPNSFVYIPMDEYKDYGEMKFDWEEPDEWDAFAKDVHDYITKHTDDFKEGETYWTNVTEQDGKVKFENLKPGLYLVYVRANYDLDDGYTYNPTGKYAFVLVPALDPETGEWQYDAEAILKPFPYDKPVLPPPSEPEYTDVTVTKIWDDRNNYDGIRPSSIQVILYSGNVIFDTQVLNERNNWSYTWRNLNAENNYWVDEVEVPAGYQQTRRVIDRDVGWLITNSHDTEVPPPPPPETTPETTPPPETETTPPETTPETIPETTPETTPETEPTPDVPVPDVPTEEIPKTGLLWWPVPVLGIGGLALVLTGAILRKKKEEK